MKGTYENHRLFSVEKESKSGEDRQIREFAAKMLPTLRMHLAAARALSIDRNASIESIIGEPAGAEPSNPVKPPRPIEKKDNDAGSQSPITPSPSEQR